MSNWINSFLEENKYVQVNWLLRRVVYLFLLFYFARLLPYANEFFSENSFINPFYFDGNPSKWIFQSFNFSLIRSNYFFFLGVEFILLILGFIGHKPKIVAFFIYVNTSILLQSIINVTNAGEQLVYNALFFMIFLEEKQQNNTHLNLLSNFAVLAVRLELAFLYMVAGYTKLTGTYWLSGDAFFIVSQIEEYSHPFLKSFMSNNLWLASFVTYFTLVYQITFPVAIWFLKTRFVWMFFGVLFHLSIGFFNGIMDFALIMIAFYFAFYTNKKAENIISFFASIKKQEKAT